ncbi:MAG: 7-carboxy-7-deazaguanine synthase QueE, partial [Rubrobacter sp.]|nr:7-carboxy-7-deazaguanine synthase QueE [Rubrobacter sp.]
MSRDTITVSEVFGPTVQGEGAVIGKPTVFVRT